MNKPYYVKRFVCPGELQAGDLWLFLVLGLDAPQIIDGVHGDKELADKQAASLNIAYQHGWDDHARCCDEGNA